MSKKSVAVRSMIHAAKVAGLQVNDATLLTNVMTEFGFARQLARAYIGNNWDKVDATKPIEAIEKVRETKPEPAVKVEATAEEKAAKIATANAKRAATRAAKKAEMVTVMVTGPVVAPVAEPQAA